MRFMKYDQPFLILLVKLALPSLAPNLQGKGIAHAKLFRHLETHRTELGFLPAPYCLASILVTQQPGFFNTGSQSFGSWSGGSSTKHARLITTCKNHSQKLWFTFLEDSLAPSDSAVRFHAEKADTAGNPSSFLFLSKGEGGDRLKSLVGWFLCTMLLSMPLTLYVPPFNSRKARSGDRLIASGALQ